MSIYILFHIYMLKREIFEILKLVEEGNSYIYIYGEEGNFKTSIC